METTRRVIPEWYDKRQMETELDSIVLGTLADWQDILDNKKEADDRAWGRALNTVLEDADRAFRPLLERVVREIELKAGPFIAVTSSFTATGGLRIALPDEVSDSLDRAMDSAAVLIDEARERLRNRAVELTHDQLGLVPDLAPFAPWRRPPADARQATERPKPRGAGSHLGASRTHFSWRAWLVVAGLFLLLSSIHTGAGHLSFNALLESIDSVKVERMPPNEATGSQGHHVLHAPFEKWWGLVCIVVLTAISYCSSLYAIVRSKNFELPPKDRRLARSLGIVISAVLVILLIASCILLTHGQPFDRVVVARCLGHLGSGIGLIVAFHIAEEMVMRFLGRYLRSTRR